MLYFDSFDSSCFIVSITMCKSEDGLNFVTFIEGPPVWSSGQSSWLQIRRPGFDSRHYQIFWGGKKKGNSSGSGTGSIQPREYN
jgi:hypothetical protein